jgi:hypothetical protein
MTPRIKESNFANDLSSFSSELFSQLNHKELVYKLDGEGDFFKFWHPALIKCRHLFENNPQDLTFRANSSGWSVVSFKNQQEAALQMPGMKTYEGFPWAISQFLKDSPKEAMIDFGQLGSVYLSKSHLYDLGPEKPELYQHIMPIWLDYALSPELWGPAGKWTRFHKRLNTLFENYGLLVDRDFPGFYPLKKEAQWISKFGFQGRLTQTSFDLILTWDFPLTGLIELEKVLARGP